MAPPQVRYARSGDVNVAFQAIGDGELDLVLILGALTNLNVFWDEPASSAPDSRTPSRCSTH